MTLPAIAPLHPILGKTVPIGREWIYELKLDGFRGMLHIDGGRARFRSKNSNHMRRFDALALSLARTLAVRNAILDGEIVVMGKNGPDFNALFLGRAAPTYAAFDLLWLDDRDLRLLPLWRRKRALRKLISSTPIGYVEHVNDPAVLTFAVQSDLEGIVAKRRTDDYRPDTRWIKVKRVGYSQADGRWELFRR